MGSRMLPQNTGLVETLKQAVAPGFRGRLLDRGIARGLIWSEGKLPEGSPAFAGSLTEDLLDYAYAVMSIALQVRTEDRTDETAKIAFLAAGEAIQAAVHRGDDQLLDRGFHRVNAGIAFHLAGYSAMAYSMVPDQVEGSNLAPTEEALVLLFRRRLPELRDAFSNWLRNDRNLDHGVSIRLRDDDDFNAEDAAHHLITTAFMRGLAWFDHAISVGQPEAANSGLEILRNAAEVAGQLSFVNHWWTCTLAAHLVDDLWDLSLHQRLPTLPPDDPDSEQWNAMRLDLIQRLINVDRPTLELWPSQVEAAERAIDPNDNLAVGLPTSAGKTRVAELCILRTLASKRRTVYVTPLRALSAQIERDLAQTFLPLGFSVSSLYDSVAIDSGDGETLRQGDIVVATPEKLSFALRNDGSLIDDVGLVVFDEGHMLGQPNEREVRYETLIESMLSRDDSAGRRIISLSALFPEPQEMADVVAWIRQDEPGEPIYSDWRPTRRRFGTIRWLDGVSRLDMEAQGQASFVPRFIVPQPPPNGSRRRKRFPSDKDELTLAAAWQFIEQDRRVFVYCPLRSSVEKLGRLVLQSVRQRVLIPFQVSNASVQGAINTGIEWLGEDHVAVQCLRYGVALHHGGLPRPFLNEVERLLRSGECPLVVASPTLAQGLNLSCSVMLVPSIWRNRDVVPATEFSNVVGRAGRAFVDLEGLVIHIIWEDTAAKRNTATNRWNRLISSSGTIRAISGLLELTVGISSALAQRAGIPFEEVVTYLASNAQAWDLNPASDVVDTSMVSKWESDIASLDSFILALIEPDTDASAIDGAMSQALRGSLFERSLKYRDQIQQAVLPQLVAERARRIWSGTNEMQRRGFRLSGVGYQAGANLDTEMSSLVSLLLEAENAILNRNAQRLIDAVSEFANVVCQVAPFRPQRGMPDKWQDALSSWLGGSSASSVVSVLGSDGVDFIQDALTYRLPWAMEAVRVHAGALGLPAADELQGLAAMATGVGSNDISVITLIRSGLKSREAARRAVESTGAEFQDRTGMEAWLASEVVQINSQNPDWPSSLTHHEWRNFYDHHTQRHRQRWTRETSHFNVKWHGSPPASGADVVLEWSSEHTSVAILSPDYRELGTIQTPLDKPSRYIVRANVGANLDEIAVHSFGPVGATV